MSKQTVTPNRPVRTPSRQTPGRQVQARPGIKKAQAAAVKPFQMPFDAKNIRIILLGILVVALGYFLMYMSPTMSTMALTISPIILLLGYCVIIPIGIMAGARNFKRKTVPLEQSNGGSGFTGIV